MNHIIAIELSLLTLTLRRLGALLLHDLMLSQSFQPTGAQLSNKAASPLAKSLATALCRSINIGSKIDVDYVAPFSYFMVVITPLFRYSAVEYHVGARNCKLRLT